MLLLWLLCGILSCNCIGEWAGIRSVYHLRPSWTCCIKAADFCNCTVSESVRICLTICETPLAVNTHGNDKYTSSLIPCSPCGQQRKTLSFHYLNKIISTKKIHFSQVRQHIFVHQKFTEFTENSSTCIPAADWFQLSKHRYALWNRNDFACMKINKHRNVKKIVRNFR